MTPKGLRYERTGGLWLMRIGPEGSPILVVPPLFEELNRTRALLARMMRRLAELGHATLLPDLPGTGESEAALETISWTDWREAVVEAGRGAVATVALRGGCLLDDSAATPCAWRFAPAEGASLIRDLERAGMVAGGGSAGYAPDAALIEAVRSARPAPLPGARTLRLASDRGEADLKLDGPSLWRRSEPQNSYELADALASDISAFLKTCGAC